MSKKSPDGNICINKIYNLGNIKSKFFYTLILVTKEDDYYNHQQLFQNGVYCSTFLIFLVLFIISYI